MDRLDYFEQKLLELERKHKKLHPELYQDKPDPDPPPPDTREQIKKAMKTIKPK